MFVYSRDQLLALYPAGMLLADRPDIPSELRRKSRAWRAGKEHHRPRWRRYTSWFHPAISHFPWLQKGSVIMENVKSPREPPATRTVQRWSEESEEALKHCFESTVWEVLCDDHRETRNFQPFRGLEPYCRLFLVFFSPICPITSPFSIVKSNSGPFLWRNSANHCITLVFYVHQWNVCV